MPKAVVLTALEVEHRAVLAHLTNLREETHSQGTVYECGTFEANGRTWDVALVQIGMGNPPAAFEAERAISFLAADVALFVGVAGGLKDVALGDVVAASKVYGYEFGKAGEHFQQRPEVGRSTYRMVKQTSPGRGTRSTLASPDSARAERPTARRNRRSNGRRIPSDLL